MWSRNGPEKGPGCSQEPECGEIRVCGAHGPDYYYDHQLPIRGEINGGSVEHGAYSHAISGSSVDGKPIHTI